MVRKWGCESVSSRYWGCFKPYAFRIRVEGSVPYLESLLVTCEKEPQTLTLQRFALAALVLFPGQVYSTLILESRLSPKGYLKPYEQCFHWIWDSDSYLSLGFLSPGTCDILAAQLWREGLSWTLPVFCFLASYLVITGSPSPSHDNSECLQMLPDDTLRV